MKCKECSYTTKQTTGICFNCEIILQLMRIFESQIGRNPINGRPRKLEILKYKITRL